MKQSEKSDRKVVFVHDGPMRFDANGQLIVTNNTLLLKKRYEYLGAQVSFMMRAINTTIVENENSGKKINFIQIPAFNRLSSLKNYFNAKQKIAEAIKSTDIAVIRLPSTIGAVAVHFARKFKKPYIVEVVGCPWDTLVNYSLTGKLYAPFARIKLKSKVRRAPYLVYVSQKFLQQRYPSSGFQTCISNVIINQTVQSIDNRINAYSTLKHKTNITLSTLGAVDVPYKGQEFVIRAVAELKTLGYSVHYRIAGLGDTKRLKAIAEKYQVADLIHFEGLLERSEIFKLLDDTDIYVQPSLTEGLPRSVVEAMSRGCICIGTNVGGIPELIQPDLLFSRGKVSQIVDLIIRIIKLENPEQIVLRNFELSKSFNSDVLEKKRIDFYDRFLSYNGM